MIYPRKICFVSDHYIRLPLENKDDPWNVVSKTPNRGVRVRSSQNKDISHVGGKSFFFSPQVVRSRMSINRTDAIGRNLKVRTRFHSEHKEFLYVFVSNTLQNSIYYLQFGLPVMSLFLSLLSFPMLLSAHYRSRQTKAGGRKKGLQNRME